MTQSTKSQGLHKTEPERPIPPLIIGSTDVGTQDDDHPQLLSNTEPMNEETLSPQPADSIVMQKEGSLVAPPEQTYLGQQVRLHKAFARKESGSQGLGPRST